MACTEAWQGVVSGGASQPSRLTVPGQNVPIAVVAKFLKDKGAALLGRVLAGGRGLGMTILIGRFNSVSVSDRLLISISRSVIRLDGNYVYYAVGSNLMRTICGILRQTSGISCLIVRAAKMTSPLPVLLAFLNARLQSLAQLSSIVALMSTSTFTPSLFSDRTTLGRVACNSVVLLGGASLITRAAIRGLRTRVRDVGRKTHVVHYRGTTIPLPLVLSINFGSPVTCSTVVPLKLTKGRPNRRRSRSRDRSRDRARRDRRRRDSPDPNRRDPSRRDRRRSSNSRDPSRRNRRRRSRRLRGSNFISISCHDSYPFTLHRFRRFLRALPESIFHTGKLL